MKKIFFFLIIIAAAIFVLMDKGQPGSENNESVPVTAEVLPTASIGLPEREVASLDEKEKRENVLIEANDPIIIFLKCIIFFLIISIFLVLILLVYYIRNAL